MRNENDFGFDLEFLSEEEIEQMIDNVVLDIGKKIQEQESQPHIINPKRMREFSVAFNALKVADKYNEWSLTYELHDTFSSVGTISIESDDIVFDSPEKVAIAYKLASNVDIYPLTSGKVKIDFTFYGITLPIGDNQDV